MNGQDDDVEAPAQRGTAEPGVTGLRMVTPLADADEQGGEPACYANLVCEECGSVTTEGHREVCSHYVRPAGG